jgi:hypothetical protein
LNHRPLGYEPKGSMLSPVDSVTLPRSNREKEAKPHGFRTLLAREVDIGVKTSRDKRLHARTTMRPAVPSRFGRVARSLKGQMNVMAMFRQQFNKAVMA